MPRRTRRALNRIRARTWSSWNWTNSGTSFKKKNKLWIWLAFDRSGQRLVDWECGGRDAATLNRLLERLKPWSVTLYCTDDYAPYDTLLPVGRHYIGKDETVAIERVNSRLRHWFARFRRRTCVVSKALGMVDATSLPPTTSIEQRQNSPCHCLLNTLFLSLTSKFCEKLSIKIQRPIY